MTTVGPDCLKNHIENDNELSTYVENDQNIILTHTIYSINNIFLHADSRVQDIREVYHDEQPICQMQWWLPLLGNSSAETDLSLSQQRIGFWMY